MLSLKFRERPSYAKPRKDRCEQEHMWTCAAVRCRGIVSAFEGAATAVGAAAAKPAAKTGAPRHASSSGGGIGCGDHRCCGCL